MLAYLGAVIVIAAVVVAILLIKGLLALQDYLDMQ
jgi:hypothetical protein